MNPAFQSPLGLSLSKMLMPGAEPAPKPAGGLFKPGSKGQIIAGIIGDALAAASGGSPVFTQNLMAQRQREQELQAQEAQWTRRRQAERTQNREDKLWERDNIPSQGDALERALKASNVLPGTPEWTAAMKRRADNLLNPMMAVQTVDAQGNPAITYTPRNGVRAEPSAPPSAAIEYLRQNPAMKDAFEQKYGAGSAATYLNGGPAPQAPVTFP